MTQLKYRLSEGSGECYYYLGARHTCLAHNRALLHAAAAAVLGLTQSCAADGFQPAKHSLRNFQSAGVEDDGWPRGLKPADMESSLSTLHAMAKEVHACEQVGLADIPSFGLATRSCQHRQCSAMAPCKQLKLPGRQHSC